MVRLENVLVCIDRDGTIVYDNKYYLGRQRDWKSEVKFLKNVVKGIKKLMKIKNIKIYIITNQPAVAIKDFPLLTQRKAEEVSQYVIDMLKEKGAIIDGFKVCGHANSSYVKRKKEFKFDGKYVCDCPCIKPKPGMVIDVLKKESLKKSNTSIYVLGDRLSDVQTGINAKGWGILIPFSNMKGEKEKVKRLKSKNKYIAKDFLSAAEFIVSKEGLL